MSDPQTAASALLELILVKHGDTRTPAKIQDDEKGEAVLFGSSVLDIHVQAAKHDASPPAHAQPGWLIDAPRIEHRWVASERLRVDLWQWRARADANAEQTLDLAATFVWEGDAYRLDLFSNSIDFDKGLGRELPAAMTWPSLLEVVREFVGAPPLDLWNDFATVMAMFVLVTLGSAGLAAKCMVAPQVEQREPSIERAIELAEAGDPLGAWREYYELDQRGGAQLSPDDLNRLAESLLRSTTSDHDPAGTAVLAEMVARQAHWIAKGHGDEQAMHQAARLRDEAHALTHRN